MKLIEQMRKQVDEEVKLHKKSPKISNKSKILAKKRSRERTPNADEEVVRRLMVDAKRRQNRPAQFDHPQYTHRINGVRDIEICEEEEECKSNQTGDCASALDIAATGSFVKSTKAKKPTNVVSRLYEWDKEKESRLKEVRDNYVNNYSFTPRINEVSKMLIELDDPQNPHSRNFKLGVTRG